MSISNPKKRKTVAATSTELNSELLSRLKDELSVENNIMDKQDVLQKMHISERTLQEWRREGMLPYYPIKNKFYYKYSDILLMLEVNKVVEC